MASTPVTIIVPVYGDWSSLEDCIKSLKKHVDPEMHKIVLVNDCGPDVELIERNILASIGGLDGFEYHRNKKNLGFVGTCNRAVRELDKTDNDILLLNSDTIVTKGFLEEMVAVLGTSKENGTVSPRSNNASIFTIPLSSASKKDIEPKKSYEIYKKIKKYLPRQYESPVSHGFCMLIKRSLVNKYGLFDDVFGKGYGEEVDFCMRIKKYGFKCVVANHAYVFHMEARSFSLETKSKLLGINNEIIWKRYPNYRQLVRDYMDEKIPFETSVEQKAGVKSDQNIRVRIKQLIKRNKYARALIKKIKLRN